MYLRLILIVLIIRAYWCINDGSRSNLHVIFISFLVSKQTYIETCNHKSTFYRGIFVFSLLLHPKKTSFIYLFIYFWNFSRWSPKDTISEWWVDQSQNSFTARVQGLYPTMCALIYCNPFCMIRYASKVYSQKLPRYYNIILLLFHSPFIISLCSYLLIIKFSIFFSGNGYSFQ